MAISTTNVGTNTGGGAATLSVTVPVGGVPAGALIFVCATDGNTTAGGSVADTAGNTYTLISSVSLNNSTANGTLRTYYAKNVSALVSGNTITLTRPGTTGFAAMSVMYATGVDTAAPLDTAVTATSFGLSTTPSVTSGTPSQSGELFIGVVGQNSTTTFTQDTGHGWAAPPTRSTSVSNDCAGGSQVNAGTGTKIFSPTISLTAYGICINGFKAAAVSKPFPNLAMLGW